MIAEIYSSKSESLPFEGINSDLFRTTEGSLFSVPPKYSIYLNFLVNSKISSCSSFIFGLSGVGVNFSPFDSMLISDEVNCFVEMFFFI